MNPTGITEYNIIGSGEIETCVWVDAENIGFGLRSSVRSTCHKFLFYL